MHDRENAMVYNDMNKLLQGLPNSIWIGHDRATNTVRLGDHTAEIIAFVNVKDCTFNMNFNATTQLSNIEKKQLARNLYEYTYDTVLLKGWIGDFNGYEVGWDKYDVVGLYSLGYNAACYVDPDTRNILEVMLDTEAD